MTNILDKLAKEVDKISAKTPLDKGKTKSKTNKSVPKKNEKDSDKKDTLMDELLAKKLFHFPQVGDTVSGKVLDVSSNEVYLDLTPFGTGIILGKEIKDGLANKKLKIGDEVTATILDLENEDDYIELSIRKASYEKAWDDIEIKKDTQDKVSTKILSANKGGLLVEVNGISGFLPVSQLSSKNYPRVEDGDKNKILNLLKMLVSQELDVCILDADRETEKLIVSEKAAQSEQDKKVISALHVGDVISGEISGVVDFGAFVKFNSPIAKEKNEKEEINSSKKDNEKKLEGLVHISELAWQLIEDPRTIVKVGDKVKAKIIGINNDKISLSIRALQKDPWSEVEKKYKVGDIVPGTVNKINHFGAFVYLDKHIHGLAHISEMSEAYPGKSLDELIKTNEVYNWKILSIEPKNHRMGLVLTDKKAKTVSAKTASTTKKTTKEVAKKDTKKSTKEEKTEKTKLKEKKVTSKK